MQARVNTSIALNVDLPPTMLDYAGVEIPDHYQGHSLRPLVAGETPSDWRTDFFCEHLMDYRPRSDTDGGIPKYEGVRGPRWVYARYFQQTPVHEFLHDLKNDPQQLKNLATDPAYEEQLEAARTRCDELRDGLGGEYSLEKFPLAPPRKPRQQRKKKAVK